MAERCSGGRRFAQRWKGHAWCPGFAAGRRGWLIVLHKKRALRHLPQGPCNPLVEAMGLEPTTYALRRLRYSNNLFDLFVLLIFMRHNFNVTPGFSRRAVVQICGAAHTPCAPQSGACQKPAPGIEDGHGLLTGGRRNVATKAQGHGAVSSARGQDVAAGQPLERIKK
jgi:hypothetical protein